jgi:hypothetical protein
MEMMRSVVISLVTGRMHRSGPLSPNLSNWRPERIPPREIESPERRGRQARIGDRRIGRFFALNVGFE